MLVSNKSNRCGFIPVGLYGTRYLETNSFSCRTREFGTHPRVDFGFYEFDH